MLPVICTPAGWAAYRLPRTCSKASDLPANGEKGACSLKMTSWRSNTLALCVCNPSKRHPAGCPSTAYLPWARALPGRMRAFPGVPRQARAKAWGPVRQEGYVCSTRGSSSRSGVVAVGNAAGQAVITEETSPGVAFSQDRRQNAPSGSSFLLR